MADLATALRDFNKERKFSRKGPLCVALVITQHARKMGLPLDPDKLLTDAGIHIRAGCFFGSLDEFRSAVTETHGSSEHGREYAAAIVMIEAHASLFGVDVATAAEKQAAEAA